MKKKIVIVMALIIGIIIMGCTSPIKSDKSEEVIEEDYIPVEVETVSKGDLYDEIIYVGRFSSVEDGFIIPSIPGRVKSVEVKPGDEVKKGDLLFTIENEEIENQLEMTKKALDDFNTNISMANIEEIDTSKFPDREPSPVRELEMAYEQAKAAAEKLKIKSPLNGFVTSVNVKKGGFATNSDYSMLVSDLNNMYLEINVTDGFLKKIVVGEEVYIDIPSRESENIIGVIESISLSPNMRTGLYTVTISVENDVDVVPGSIGKVNIRFDQVEDAIVIPSDAVLDINDEKVVYVVEDNVAREVYIKVGLDTGDKVEVLEGLVGGESLIVKGQNYVTDKSKVKIVRGESQ